MSEETSRLSASRGRGSGRGGRGGFAGRGGRRANGDKIDTKAVDGSPSAFDDEGDFAELRKQYGSKTSVIREMFPDWSEADVLYALQETNGDENEAVARIAEGAISQWGEVSKPKKATRPKTKEPASSALANESSTSGPRATRGGRAVSEGSRGRGRVSDRGGRGGRGRPTNPVANGARHKENSQLSVPTEESNAWGEANEQVGEQEQKTIVTEKPALVAEVPKAAAPQAKTWASLVRASATPKVVPKPKEAPAPAVAIPESTQPEAVTEPAAQEPIPEPAKPEEETTPVAPQADVTEPAPAIIEPEVALPPSKDELTQTNLEQVVDESKPPATGTAASTAADSWDPRQNPASTNATPLSAAHQQHQTQRPAAPSSGYATSAIKATTEKATRAPSYQRRVLDQEEAVRMPGNREVDRAAVQFGAFNLDDGEEDIDGDREEPETRAQPPAESPVAHPRASLPPVAQPSAVPETFAQKPVAAVPGAASAAAVAPQAPGSAQVPQGPAAGAHQLGRYGQAGPQDVSQKPLDPFNQQNTPSTQPPFDSFSAQTSQAQSQQPSAAFTSAPSEYSSYYTANQQDRNAYNNYYGQQYGQHAAHGQQQEAVQRGYAGYNASQADNMSQYPQSGAHQPRFGSNSGDAQNSGHSTPNPTAQAQQATPQGQAQQQSQGPQQQQQGQQQQGQQPNAPGSQPQSHGQYPNYNNHPYYTNPYYHQYYSGYGQGGFGPYGKGGMYGQPYGVAPNAPYDQSSPASFAHSSLHRDSSLTSGLGEYGRAGSGQAANQPGLGGSSFGSVHDTFSRGAASFQTQAQSFNNQAQPAAGAANDDLKPFSDAKAGSGPSPSLGGARPGSAANNAPAGQSGLPPPQNAQMGGAYGGYPSHLQGHGLHGSSAYGMGAGAGVGGNQHGNSPYGSYSQGFGGSGYYGGQQQQQRSGWGGNYH
jgi:hypothetical protein